jgi:hypothetical protein
MPTGALVIVEVVPPAVTGADAVTLVAPAELGPAVFKRMEAVPPTVNAVAEAGSNATSALDAAKVTTASDTSVPLASLSVAVAVAGVPYITELEEKLKVREPEPDGVGVGVGVEPVEPDVPSGPVPHP